MTEISKNVILNKINYIKQILQTIFDYSNKWLLLKDKFPFIFLYFKIICNFNKLNNNLNYDKNKKIIFLLKKNSSY